MERYVIRGGRDGYERLRVLSRARWPDTSVFLDSAGIRAGMTCVDVGCGSGDVSLQLARLVGSEGCVTGIDMDEVKLELARGAAAEQEVSNVEFRVANVHDWREDQAYDFVYSRFLLEHLNRPVELLARAWAALRPDGVLAVEDADFEGLFAQPRNDGFDFYKRNYSLVLKRSGGDEACGRKLFGYFLAANIPEPMVRLVQRVEVNGEAKTLALSSLQATAEPIVAEGIATRDEVNAAIDSLAAHTADPTTLVGSPRIFQVWARKPPAR